MISLKEKLSTFWNQQLTVPKSYPFIMHEEEKLLLKKVLKESAKHLEFGLGGSTIFSLLESKAEIISVDTNEKWIGFIKRYKIIKNNLSSRLKIFYVDIGPTKSWGFPLNENHKEKFPGFSSQIFEMIDCNEIDSVLIDGRFRIACALQTILNCHHNQNLKILFHDYSIRDDYKIIEKYLEIINSERTLFVFRMKQNIDVEEIKKLYEKYKYIAE